MSELTAVSLFAGIGGFDLALERSGADMVAAVEIDQECRGVLARHFPRTALFNDVTEVTGDQLRAAGLVPGRGILTGGFPCQDLSIAGRRTGLGGARSGLFWHIMRLADELRPRWLLLENVPGLLSAVCACPGDGTCLVNGRAVACGQWKTRRSPDGRNQVWEPDTTHTPPGGACAGGCMERHGGAMGTVLGALGQRGYGFAYRVLDAQFFGVPQSRDRVFIAGCLGDGAAPVQVLFDPESGPGDLAPRETPRPDPARVSGVSAGSGGVVGTLGTTSPGGGWRVGADEAATGQLVVSTLQGGGHRGHRIDAEGAAGGHLIPVAAPAIAHALTTRNERNEQEATYVTESGGTAVRRLTPLEYERLQGFPDDWTRWQADGTEQSDSARYRQCGNAVAVPVVEWITGRIAAIEARTADVPAEGAA